MSKNKFGRILSHILARLLKEKKGFGGAKMQFFNAVSNAHLDEVKKLIAEKNFNGILERDDDKQTLLHIIIQKSSDHSLEILKLLLKLKKIEINAQDSRGWTPLHCAAAKGRIDMCLELLNQRSLKVDVVNKDHNNALIFLCKAKSEFVTEVRYSVVLKLMSSSVDIDHKNKYGETALHYAALVGNKHAVQFLCSNNCNIDPLNEFVFHSFFTLFIYLIYLMKLF